MDSTPIEVIANVSRIVSRVVDRISGDRADVPLMVAAATVEALKLHGIGAQVMYGPAAWVEVLEDHSVIWAGCWNGNFSFWAATQFGEVVDLNTSVAHRKPTHGLPHTRSTMSPPMLWSREVPRFYRYKPEGVAELEIPEGEDKKKFEAVLLEVREKCGPAHLKAGEPEFPNEAILCPGRKLLDDSRQTFRQFDRAISVQGIPPAPF